jgi:hypothetical protein
MTQYLVAHTNKDGTQAAQAQVSAKNHREATKKFEEDHPDRIVTLVEVKP